MKPLPRQLIADARTRHGLLTADDLRRSQIVGRARTALLDSGLLVSIHRGVYRIASHPESFEQRCLAVCLAAPDAVLSGPTAGRLWGLRKVFTDDVHAIALRSLRLEGIAAHRTDLLGPFDVAEREGMRLLRPKRLFCDLAWHLDEAALESVFEQMLDRRMLSVVGARSAARRFTAKGRPGSVRLRRVLESRSAWLKPVDSDLELRLWRALKHRGLDLVRQHPVLLDSGVTLHLDLADPRICFGIEVDHSTWHGGRMDTQRDKWRDRELTRLGWTVSRVTDEDIKRRFEETLSVLVQIAARCTPRS